MEGSTAPKVIFEEDTHKYTFTSGDKKTISVTSFVSMFHKQFDANYWATYKALKICYGEAKFRSIRNSMGYDTYPLYLKPPQDFLDRLVSGTDTAQFFAAKDSIVADWNSSSTGGTKFHVEREDEIYEAGGATNPWTGTFLPVANFKKDYDNQSIIDNLSELEDGVYPELLVWLELDKTAIVGQIDVCLIETVSGQRNVYLRDFKTNKSLKAGPGNDTFHKPFGHLKADKITKYSLQLTLYSYILAKWGFTPKEQEIIHYKNYDPTTGKRHPLTFYRDEAELMIRMFNSQNK